MARIALGVLVFGALFAAPSARAELFRCEDAAGRVTYSDDRHGCKKASPHQPRRRLQESTAPKAPAARARRMTPRSRSASDVTHANQAAEGLWRQKRVKAERALADAERQIPQLDIIVTRCNRGGDVWVTDDAGLKHGVSCDQIQAARDKARSESARLRAYLDKGIEEECRKAGCLPGWIR